MKFLDYVVLGVVVFTLLFLAGGCVGTQEHPSYTTGWCCECGE